MCKRIIQQKHVASNLGLMVNGCKWTFYCISTYFIDEQWRWSFLRNIGTWKANDLMIFLVGMLIIRLLHKCLGWFTTLVFGGFLWCRSRWKRCITTSIELMKMAPTSILVETFHGNLRGPPSDSQKHLTIDLISGWKRRGKCHVDGKPSWQGKVVGKMTG